MAALCFYVSTISSLVGIATLQDIEIDQNLLVTGVVHAFFTFPGKLNTFVPVQNIDKNK
jgi:hypothetical protein